MQYTQNELNDILAKHRRWLYKIEGWCSDDFADLCGANLRDADLCDANLRGANLRGAKNCELALAMCEIVPREGGFMGWKKCLDANDNPVLVKLHIPEDAKRSNATGRKCRCSKAEVLEMTRDNEPVSEAHSVYRTSFLYHVGDVLEYGWMAKLEHEYKSAYKATLWNDGHGLAIYHSLAARDAEQAAMLAAHFIKHYHDRELWPSDPDECIRRWYTYTCPTDELGDEIDPNATFADYLIALAKDGDAYCYGIDDSIVRQRVMAATAQVMSVSYDRLYELWR